MGLGAALVCSVILPLSTVVSFFLFMIVLFYPEPVEINILASFRYILYLLGEGERDIGSLIIIIVTVILSNIFSFPPSLDCGIYNNHHHCH